MTTLKRYEEYSLGEAAKGLYEFVWNDFCDWYLELIKPRLNVGDNPTDAQLEDQRITQQVLLQVLRHILLMLHPLMPHLTEELWHAITGFSEKKLLSLEIWPELQTECLNDQLEDSFIELFASIRLVRNLRAVAGMKPSQEVPVCFVTRKTDLAETLKKAIVDIQVLTRASRVDVLNPDEMTTQPAVKALAGVTGELEVILPIEGLVDISALRQRLEKDLLKAQKEISTLSARLSNSNFANKAPEEVVSECRSKLFEAQSQADLVQQRLSGLN